MTPKEPTLEEFREAWQKEQMILKSRGKTTPPRARRRRRGSQYDACRRRTAIFLSLNIVSSVLAIGVLVLAWRRGIVAATIPLLLLAAVLIVHIVFLAYKHYLLRQMHPSRNSVAHVLRYSAKMERLAKLWPNHVWHRQTKPVWLHGGVSAALAAILVAYGITLLTFGQQETATPDRQLQAKAELSIPEPVIDNTTPLAQTDSKIIQPDSRPPKSHNENMDTPSNEASCSTPDTVAIPTMPKHRYSELLCNAAVECDSAEIFNFFEECLDRIGENMYAKI